CYTPISHTKDRPILRPPSAFLSNKKTPTLK
ncbi:small nuclear protein PRAC1, partial [Daubentonia madagascariensis]